jgi:hypothetical protein
LDEKKSLTYLDIDKTDFYILTFLTFLLFLTGINSSLILDYISINSTVIVDRSIHLLNEITLK